MDRGYRYHFDTILPIPYFFLFTNLNLNWRCPDILLQVWAVPANGEATEVLAWRQGTVRVLRILPSPKVDIDCPVDQPSDQYEQKRPLVAICDNSGSGPQYCSVNFVSLKDGDQVKSMQ